MTEVPRHAERFRLLVCYLLAAQEQGLTERQRDGIKRWRLQDHFTILREINGREDETVLADQIESVIAIFRTIFGDYTPPADSRIGRELTERGITLAPL